MRPLTDRATEAPVDFQDTPSRAETSRLLLVLALASSAGVHAALAPAHAGKTALLGVLFALSALALLGVALRVDRAPGPVAPAAAAGLLGSLLAAYALTRLVALPPLTHAEPVEAIGAIAKLAEAAGLVLALRLCTPAGPAMARPVPREGAGP